MHHAVNLLWYHAIDLVLQVLHLCHQGRCVNPKHLVQVCSALSLFLIYLFIVCMHIPCSFCSLLSLWHATPFTPHSAHFPSNVCLPQPLNSLVGYAMEVVCCNL